MRSCIAFCRMLSWRPDSQMCFPKDPLLGRPNLRADMTFVVSTDASVVSAARISSASADRTSVVSQDISRPLTSQLCCGPLHNAIGMSWEQQMSCLHMQKASGLQIQKVIFCEDRQTRTPNLGIRAGERWESFHVILVLLAKHWRNVRNSIQ